jgi:hypothetical protein
VPKVYTSGYGGTSHAIYTFNGTGFSVNNVHMGPHFSSVSISGGGVTAGDFLNNGGLQVIYSDVSPNEAANANNRIRMYTFGSNEKPVPNSTYITLPKGYFNDKPEFAGMQTITAGIATHMAHLYSDDVNNDGKLDVMVQGVVFPGAPLPGVTGSLTYPRGKLQIDINQGGGSFIDLTDTLNPDWSLLGADERLIFKTIDGTKIIFVKGETIIANNALWPDGAGNRAFLNDGTGRLHLALSNEFLGVLPRLQTWLCANRTTIPGAIRQNWCSATQIAYDQIRFLPYFTDTGTLHYVAMAPYGSEPFAISGSQTPSAMLSIQSFAFVNVPTDINLFADFRKNITITNRNGSTRIATFAGDDVINKAAGDPSASVDGRSGRDKVVYPKARAAYAIAKSSSGAHTIRDTAAGGTTDTLTNVETAQFSDTSIDLY